MFMWKSVFEEKMILKKTTKKKIIKKEIQSFDCRCNLYNIDIAHAISLNVSVRLSIQAGVVRSQWDVCTEMGRRILHHL